MARLFEDEKRFPDNAARANFVFLGYPYEPPLPLDDYRAVTSSVQEELPVRLWYFLDEVTTQELMRKVWRAILRSDLCIFDISGGNPNVSLELGLALAINKPCITLLKSGEPNPLGSSDLGYSERAEYTSRKTLTEKLRELILAKSGALRTTKDLSYSIQSDAFGCSREEIESRLVRSLTFVFRNKRITKTQAKKHFLNDKATTLALNGLREAGVLQVEGERRGARWVFTDSWVHHDHEVVGD